MLREIIPYKIRKVIRARMPKLYLKDWLSIKMGSRKIKYIDLCPLWKCNARCPTCESWKRDPTTMISAAQANQIVNHPVFKDLEFVVVEGGEPTLWPHLRGFVSFMARKCKVSIITNCIESEMILRYIDNFLPLRKNISWCLSLNGIGAMHDASRGYKGCYKEVLKVARRLKELDFIVCFDYVPFKINEGQYEQVKTLGDELGVLVDVNFPCDSGKFGTPKWKPTTLERVKEISMVEERNWIERWVKEYFFDHVKDRKVMPCWGGRSMVSINPYGRIQTCSMNENAVIGEVLDDDVVIFHDRREELIKNTIPVKCEYDDYSICNDCMICYSARRSFPTLLKWRMGYDRSKT